MVQKVFNRYEKKYLLSAEEYKSMRLRLAVYMQEDDYGVHTIRNIYYDTDTDELIRTSLEKPSYKEKFRVRCYGVPKADGSCFLEIKKKYKGLVNKRRIQLPIAEARAYLNQGIQPKSQGQIFQEIDYFLKRYQVIPKRYIAYDRLALRGIADEEFRVTFDQNIRSRVNDLTLFSDENTELLLPPDMVLMEVKITGAMPLWFARILTKHGIYNTSFSKYGRFYMREQERQNAV